MKVIISENQLNRLFESNTILDNLNNLINNNDYIWNYGNTSIIPSRVLLQGDGNLDDDSELTLSVDVYEVLENGQDVTNFAKNWALWPGEGNDYDTPLSLEYKLFLSEKINQKILRLTSKRISEWDVELYL